jgi:hypothetical protein
VIADVSEEAVVSFVKVAVTVNQILLHGAQYVKDTELEWERRRSVFKDMREFCYTKYVKDTELEWERRRSVYEDMREFCYNKSGTGRKSDSRMAIVLSWMGTSNLSDYKTSSNRLRTTDKIMLILTESTLLCCNILILAYISVNHSIIECYSTYRNKPNDE